MSLKRLHRAVGRNAQVIASAHPSTGFVFPPTRAAIIDDAWNHTGPGCIPEFDLEFSSDAASALSSCILLGGLLEDQVLVDDDVDTVDFANNELDITTHAYFSGDGPLQLTTSDTLPTGLSLLTDYYVIWISSGAISLALTREDAMAGTAVAFSDVGAGTHTISDVVTETKRYRWQSHGLLGQAADGAISLAANKDWVQRMLHRARAEAYAIQSTVDAGNITVEAFAVVADGG